MPVVAIKITYITQFFTPRMLWASPLCHQLAASCLCKLCMNVIYLIQTDGTEVPYPLPEGSDSILLCWGQDFVPGPDKIHAPGSTWMSGRNELFRLALLKGDYDYFVFLDDDISVAYADNPLRFFGALKATLKNLFVLQLKHAWVEVRDWFRNRKKDQAQWFREYERTLAKHQPGVATCPALWHPWDKRRGRNELEGVSIGDHICLALHKSVAFDLLPYLDDELTATNWWRSSEDMHRRAFVRFPHAIVRLNRHLTFNEQYRPYPRDKTDWKLPKNTVTPAWRPIPLPERHTDTSKDRTEDQSAAVLDWNDTAIVVTSTNPPTEAIRRLDEGCGRTGASLIVIGDRKSPDQFPLNHGRFISLEEQRASEFALAAKLPENHYARKNLGYLVALASGRQAVIDIDDDNIPLPSFWRPRTIQPSCRVTNTQGWHNVYRYFSCGDVWPRGLPLERVLDDTAELEKSRIETEARVQQGLAQGDPDVDAIYRLTHQQDVYFRQAAPVHLGERQWCPINSQNTLWIGHDIAPLLYLPSTCTFRETDILRGYVAQRILWTLRLGLTFTAADVLQQRNEHDLLTDFSQETGLYQRAGQIRAALEAIDLKLGAKHIQPNMVACYEALRDLELVTSEELTLLDTWKDDLAIAQQGRAKVAG